MGDAGDRPTKRQRTPDVVTPQTQPDRPTAGSEQADVQQLLTELGNTARQRDEAREQLRLEQEQLRQARKQLRREQDKLRETKQSLRQMLEQLNAAEERMEAERKKAKNAALREGDKMDCKLKQQEAQLKQQEAQLYELKQQCAFCKEFAQRFAVWLGKVFGWPQRTAAAAVTLPAGWQDMAAAAGPTEPQGKPRVTGGAWAQYPSLLVARDQVPTFVHGDGLQLKRSADGQEYRAARIRVKTPGSAALGDADLPWYPNETDLAMARDVAAVWRALSGAREGATKIGEHASYTLQNAKFSLRAPYTTDAKLLEDVKQLADFEELKRFLKQLLPPVPGMEQQPRKSRAGHKRKSDSKPLQGKRMWLVEKDTHTFKKLITKDVLRGRVLIPDGVMKGAPFWWQPPADDPKQAPVMLLTYEGPDYPLIHSGVDAQICRLTDDGYRMGKATKHVLTSLGAVENSLMTLCVRKGTGTQADPYDVQLTLDKLAPAAAAGQPAGDSTAAEQQQAATGPAGQPSPSAGAAQQQQEQQQEQQQQQQRQPPPPASAPAGQPMAGASAAQQQQQQQAASRPAGQPTPGATQADAAVPPAGQPHAGAAPPPPPPPPPPQQQQQQQQQQVPPPPPPPLQRQPAPPQQGAPPLPPQQPQDVPPPLESVSAFQTPPQRQSHTLRPRQEQPHAAPEDQQGAASSSSTPAPPARAAPGEQPHPQSVAAEVSSSAPLPGEQMPPGAQATPAGQQAEAEQPLPAGQPFQQQQPRSQVQQPASQQPPLRPTAGTPAATHEQPGEQQPHSQQGPSGQPAGSMPQRSSADAAQAAAREAQVQRAVSQALRAFSNADITNPESLLLPFRRLWAARPKSQPLQDVVLRWSTFTLEQQQGLFDIALAATSEKVWDTTLDLQLSVELRALGPAG